MPVADQIRALLERHCSQLGADIGLIGSKISHAISDGRPCPAAIQEAVSLTHQVTGTSGSLGFSELSAIAAKLESELNNIVVSGERLDERAADAVNKLFLELQMAADNTRPSDSKLFNFDIARLGQARDAQSAN